MLRGDFMYFEPRDWSGYSYREVKSMLEEYRSSYAAKEESAEPRIINHEEIKE